MLIFSCPAICFSVNRSTPCCSSSVRQVCEVYGPTVPAASISPPHRSAQKASVLPGEIFPGRPYSKITTASPFTDGCYRKALNLPIKLFYPPAIFGNTLMVESHSINSSIPTKQLLITTSPTSSSEKPAFRKTCCTVIPRGILNSTLRIPSA